MCLAIPGKVIALESPDDPIARAGIADMQGNQLRVSLAMVPEAEIGSWILVHAGYALEVLDEVEARKTWEWLKEANVVSEIPAELSAVGVAAS